MQEDLFLIAEQEMKELRNPYVGTEHYFLAFLKNNDLKTIHYDTFKKTIKKVIGSCYKETEYVLYTPYLRKLKNSSNNDLDNVLEILRNTDSIVYNILISEKYNIEDIFEEIKNTYRGQYSFYLLFVVKYVHLWIIIGDGENENI